MATPPDDQAHLVWAFDPDLSGSAQALVGPSFALSNPTITQGIPSPSFYTFGATDLINFGDSLDSTWAGGGSFTIYLAVSPSGADIARNIAVIAGKGTAQFAHSEWSLWLDFGRPTATAYYNGGTSDYDRTMATGALTAGKHVVTMIFDATKSFGSRCTMYVDGAPIAQTRTTGGGDGFISDLTDVIQVGTWTGFTPVHTMSYIYAYNSAHTALQVSDNAGWIMSVGGKRWNDAVGIIGYSPVKAPIHGHFPIRTRFAWKHDYRNKA